MANKKAAQKALRQNIKRNARNQKVKGEMRELIKDMRTTLEKGSMDAAGLKKVMSTIDRAARKGIIKKNTASRYKSRLSLRANKAQTKTAA